MNIDGMKSATPSSFERLEKTLMIVVTSMMAFIILLTLLQVFFRYALNDALSWSAELTKIIFIWMTFLGSGIALNRGGHLRIDSLVNLLSERSRLLADLVVHGLMILFLIVLLVAGIELSWKAMAILTGALQWPRSILFLPVPTGSFFMLLFAMRIIATDVRALWPKTGSGHENP